MEHTFVSLGKCFSNAACSGALTDVCAATIAPSLVAGQIEIRKEKSDIMIIC